MDRAMSIKAFAHSLFILIVLLFHPAMSGEKHIIYDVLYFTSIMLVEYIYLEISFRKHIMLKTFYVEKIEGQVIFISITIFEACVFDSLV